MKLILLKNNLIEGLFSVERSIGINTNLPILKNVLISAENDKIMIAATNLDIAITHIILGKIIESGSITVPLGIFNAIIKNLNSERITLETKENGLFVITDNYEATIQGLDAKDFPIIPDISNKKNSIKIQSLEFLDSMKKVIVATHFSDIRPEISGVYINYSGDKLVFVATDSFRLAEKTINSTSISSDFESVSFILPLHTAEELLRVISDSDGEISVFIDQNQALFSTKTKNVTTRLIDGRFPDYQAIIPKETGTEITINRQEFINAIKLTSSFSGKTNDVCLTISENKKAIEIFSSDGSIGENKYKIPIKLKGESLSAVFNWKYILDGLKIYTSEDIVLGTNSPDRPAIIKNTSDKSIIYVVMPIRK